MPISTLKELLVAAIIGYESPQRMYPDDFGDPLPFPVVMPFL